MKPLVERRVSRVDGRLQLEDGTLAGSLLTVDEARLTEELAPWATRVRNESAVAQKVFAVTNNHYLGKGVVNALQLLSMLKGAKVNVPDPLRVKYPELEKIADLPPERPTLFPMG